MLWTGSALTEAEHSCTIDRPTSAALFAQLVVDSMDHE
jgi:hypothetical protein